MADIQDTLFGRMFPEHSLLTAVKISDQSCKPSARSSRQLISLDLRSGGGADASWEMVSPSHGDAWTLSTGESPKDAEESTLSQILMAEVPTRFCLSPRCCQGIFARAERRGKTIPPMLKDALAECMSATAKTQESRNCTESQRPLQLSTAQGGQRSNNRYTPPQVEWYFTKVGSTAKEGARVAYSLVATDYKEPPVVAYRGGR